MSDPWAQMYTLHKLLDTLSLPHSHTHTGRHYRNYYHPERLTTHTLSSKPIFADKHTRAVHTPLHIHTNAVTTWIYRDTRIPTHTSEHTHTHTHTHTHAYISTHRHREHAHSQTRTHRHTLNHLSCGESWDSFDSFDSFGSHMRESPLSVSVCEVQAE